MNKNTMTNVVDDYFGALDPVATEVVSQTFIHPDWDLSHMQMSIMVCQLLGWEDFDLFSTLDFPAVYARDNLHELHAYAMLAHLRGEVFREANRRDMGMEATNEFAASHSELWEGRLADRWRALREGVETKHSWIQ